MKNHDSLAARAQPVRLRKKTTLAEAFRRIGLNCLAQMEANVPGVLARDAESLHQMRVGLRRLRALLDMFDELAAPPPAIDKGLAWLAGELGATRDWDVLAGATLARVTGADVAALQAAADARAARLHATMHKAIASPRFTGLLVQLKAWLNGPRKHPASLDEPALRAARPLLRKAEKRLAKRIAALAPADAPARHRVRIAAKKARYAAEFFRDVLDEKTGERYVARLAALQDRLGLLNDMAVADRLLPQLQRTKGLARQAAFARGYLAAAGQAEARRLGKVLKAVAGLRMTD